MYVFYLFEKALSDGGACQKKRSLCTYSYTLEVWHWVNHDDSKSFSFSTFAFPPSRFIRGGFDSQMLEMFHVLYDLMSD